MSVTVSFVPSRDFTYMRTVNGLHMYVHVMLKVYVGDKLETTSVKVQFVYFICLKCCVAVRSRLYCRLFSFSAVSLYETVWSVSDLLFMSLFFEIPIGVYFCSEMSNATHIFIRNSY
jgi:hypothetical protein